VKLWVSRLARVCILVVSVLALYRLFPVVADQLKGLETCPMLGPVPACYLVFVGYIAIGVSVVLEPLRSGWVFLSGWLPVFLFALLGTSMGTIGDFNGIAGATHLPSQRFRCAVVFFLAGHSQFVVRGFLFSSPNRRREQKRA